MRRVYLIFALRQLTRPMALKTYVFGGIVIGVLSSVSLGAVISNTPSWSPGGLYRFYTAAFLNTDFIVQTLVVAAALSAMWLSRDVARGMFSLGIRRLVTALTATLTTANAAGTVVASAARSIDPQ